MPENRPNDFLGLLRALTASELNFIVIGGVAAVMHGASTATQDLDVLMPFEIANCARLLQAVLPLHPRLSHTPERRSLNLSASELASFKNLYLSTDLGRLDILSSLISMPDLDSVMESASTMDVEGIQVRVISLSMLIQVKSALGRPKDKQVEMELRAIMNAAPSSS